VASRSPNFYKLKKGATFNDLFPMDFLDILWQAFEKDKLETITLEISRPKKRIKMMVVDVVKKKTKPP
jgi:hypothetical protein